MNSRKIIEHYYGKKLLLVGSLSLNCLSLEAIIFTEGRSNDSGGAVCLALRRVLMLGKPYMSIDIIR